MSGTVRCTLHTSTYLKKCHGTSSQDGNVGRHGSPPPTTTSKLQLYNKIQNNHHSEPSESELNGGLTTPELNKPHHSRLVRGVEMWNGLVPHACVVDKKFRRDNSGVRSPIPTPGPPAQGFSAKKRSPHNFWLQKQWRLSR